MILLKCSEDISFTKDSVAISSYFTLFSYFKCYFHHRKVILITFMVPAPKEYFLQIEFHVLSNKRKEMVLCAFCFFCLREVWMLHSHFCFGILVKQEILRKHILSCFYWSILSNICSLNPLIGDKKNLVERNVFATLSSHISKVSCFLVTY